MTNATPLVGALQQRTWQDIVRFRPLTQHPYEALVVVRGGRIVSVVPADSRHTLSDYLALPYSYHTIDTREQTLVIQESVESIDPDVMFDLQLQATYHIVEPAALVRLARDVVPDIVQSMLRQIQAMAATFGVERARQLEAQLGDALLQSDGLRTTLHGLGIALGNVTARVGLSDGARGRAAQLQHLLRERPLPSQLSIPSNDFDTQFDVQVSGSYRPLSRSSDIPDDETQDAIVRAVLERVLGRVGSRYSWQEYMAASNEMSVTLRSPLLIRDELAAAQVDLIAPGVIIHPSRQMLHKQAPEQELITEPASRPASPKTPSSSRPVLREPHESDQLDERVTQAWLASISWEPAGHTQAAAPTDAVAQPEATDQPPVPDDTPDTSANAYDWLRATSEPRQGGAAEADLADATADGYNWMQTPPEPPAADPQPAQPQTPFRWMDYAAGDANEAVSEEQPAPEAANPVPAAGQSLSTADDGAEASEQDGDALPDWMRQYTPTSFVDSFLDSVPDISSQQPAWDEPVVPVAEPVAQPQDMPPPDMPPAPPPTMPAEEPISDPQIQQQIDRWLMLLQDCSAALFELRALDLIEQPGYLPQMLRKLSPSMLVLQHTDSPQYQHALVQVLRSLLHQQRTMEPPSASTEQPGFEDVSSWDSLRQGWNNQ